MSGLANQNQAFCQNTSRYFIPEMSVFNTLLFLIYINDIDKSSDSFDFICYADDTTLSSIMNYFSSTEQSIENSINDELSKSKLLA